MRGLAAEYISGVAHVADRTGTVSLGRFYVRRALRLLPALFVLVAVVGAYASISGRDDDTLSAAPAVLLYAVVAFYLLLDWEGMVKRVDDLLPTASLHDRAADALIAHGQNLAHLMEPVMATGSVHGELLGDLSPDLRANFADDGPVQLFTPWISLSPQTKGR